MTNNLPQSKYDEQGRPIKKPMTANSNTMFYVAIGIVIFVLIFFYTPYATMFWPFIVIPLIFFRFGGIKKKLEEAAKEIEKATNESMKDLQNDLDEISGQKPRNKNKEFHDDEVAEMDHILMENNRRQS